MNDIDGEEDEDEDSPEIVHKRKMEDGGFTLVQIASDNLASKTKKYKVTDESKTTTMLGISQKEADKAYRESLKRGQPIQGLDDEEYFRERERVLREEAAEKNEEFITQAEALKKEGLPSLYDGKRTNKKELMQHKMMYPHLKKEEKKKDLEALQQQFEVYKKRIAKQQAKMLAAQK